MKLLALVALGVVASVAWFFEIALLKTLLIFGGIGVLVIQYEKIFDAIFSSNSSSTETVPGKKKRATRAARQVTSDDAYWQGAHIKNCASCQYWSGKRQIESTRTGLSFDQFEHAKCVGGGRDRVDVSAVQICQQYTKMPSLK